MKILIFSDSHGNTQALMNAVFDTAPQLILHLGDYERDCAAVRKAYPDICLRAVRGNGDLRGAEPDYDEFLIEGKRIFMTHGHLYGVKTGLDSLLNAGFLRGADIILFGHTHIPFNRNYDGLLLLNPGSIGLGAKTYAVLDIEHGAVKSQIFNLEG